MLSTVRLQHGEVARIVAWREEDVFALRNAHVQTKMLSQLMIRSLLATTDIDDAEERLGQAERATEC